MYIIYLETDYTLICKSVYLFVVVFELKVYAMQASICYFQFLLEI